MRVAAAAQKKKNVLRFLKISVLLDPALSATVAAVGLYFRSGNLYEDLFLEHDQAICSDQRQKSVSLDLLRLWAPYVPLADLARALANPSKGTAGRLCQLKVTTSILAGMQSSTCLSKEKGYLRRVESWHLLAMGEPRC